MSAGKKKSVVSRKNYQKNVSKIQKNVSKFPLKVGNLL
jgi:hypothetical protein